VNNEKTKYMNRQRHYIRTLLLMLLIGGTVNEAWATSTTVTYHVISLPFGTNTGYYDGNGDFVNVEYRIEAIKKTVTCDSEDDIVIPAELKSPLMKYEAYSYYTGATRSALTKIFPDNPSTFYTYTFESATDVTGLKVGDKTDIYVTYDWATTSKREDYGNKLDLTGGKEYNIEFTSSDGSGSWLYALNMNPERGNRAQAVPASYINNLEELCSDAPVTINKAVNGKTIFYFKWKFINDDPYNIIMQTAYTGDFTYTENGVRKSPVGAQFFGSLDGSNKIKTNWLTSEVDQAFTTPITTKHGWFRGPSGEGGVNTNGVSANLYFSFTLLAHPTATYTLVSSWANVNGNNWVPNSSGQYLLMQHTPEAAPYAGPKFADLEAADQVRIYEIRDYDFNVKTPFGNTVSISKKLSDYQSATTLLSHVPDALKRKYTSLDGAYKEETLRTSLSTLQDAIDNAADETPIQVWLKYSVSESIPFETLPVGGSYANATWYTIRMNGDVETQYLGYLDDDSNHFYTGLGSNDNLHQGENDSKAQFAFIGDPYELKIINREASETATANRYVGCATGAGNNSTLSPQTGSSDISTWEIVYEATQPGNMIMRQFDTADDPKYIGWAYGTSNNPMVYSTTSSRIRVVELANLEYTYYIVRSDGSIAVKATEAQEYGIKLEYSTIPEIIRSPFLALSGVTITFYWTLADAIAETDAKEYASNSPENHEIYVRYDMGTSLSTIPGSYITGAPPFNVRLNGQYIYYDSATGTIKSTANIEDSDSDGETDDEEIYQWVLDGSDPYAMTIKAVGNARYVTVADWATGTVSWSDTAPDSKFIIKSGTGRAYEVMAATGSSVDASTTYYNFGRPDANTVKMFRNEGAYLHGYDAISFYLEPLNAVGITYHLIDLKGKDLLQVEGRQATTEAPHFPDEYQSPLVTTNGYHYWLLADFDETENYFGEGVSKYTLVSPTPEELNEIGLNRTIYVTYDIGHDYDMINKKDMYLLKFEAGTAFRAEDGSDGLEASAVTPVYPYCNGDCNFFVYGEEQFDIQQQGAASTRTRWAWFLESDDNDPYHVKICSRQTETYNGDELRAYFRTYQPGDYDKIVTNLVWPSISGLQGSEYMILGTNGHYRLMTTETVALDTDHDGTPESDERVIVKNFEQYWKTYDTVKNKLLKNILEESDKGANASGSITVPYTPASYRELLTGNEEGQYGFHSYSKWAYAKRFNGYNAAGKTSKGWEELEHWFETVEMGEGYFDLIPIEINPVLILLDQHGWEIMRKPLPTSPDDETKWAKYDEIRPYDSPMVKEYYFWTKASKRSGFHQYYNLSQQVTVDGSPFTSTSLIDLPPYNTATNIKDAKGNQLDQYVTYTVKDEFVQSVSIDYVTESARDASSNDYTRIKSITATGQPFLIQQGDHFATVAGADATAVTKGDVPTTGGMSQYIIENIGQLTTTGTKNNELWYLMPNFEIDDEMGYSDPAVSSSISWVNDYRNQAKVKATGFNSWAFDPYNIQISSVPYNSKYFVTNATGSTLEEGDGSIIGIYSAAAAVSLGEQQSVSGTWHDGRTLDMTNATFMAVQDADGNMQLMPRFDQTRRMKDFSTLVSPKDSEKDQTYTQLFHPYVYNYVIVDSVGRESLRYKSGGDLIPQTPDHFKSPLAKDYTYYKDLTYSTGTYTEVANGDDISSKKITASLVGAGLTTPAVDDDNQIYVRYKYDEDADNLQILRGKWLTMRLNEKDVQYTTGIYADESPATKTSPIDDTKKKWQWKFLETPQSTPDPYAVQLFNRANTPGKTALPTASTRFALLSHEDGGYALAVAGEGSDATYNFLNGTSMTDAVAATTALETGFLSTSCNYADKGSQVLITDEVVHTYNYKIYTHDGDFAVDADQSYSEAVDNEYTPVLPSVIQTPLLGIDKFRYYESLADTAYNSGMALTYLLGLYDDVVYVRYNAYDLQASEYLIPNDKGTSDGHVAKGSRSNDTPLRIDGKLPYNIIWYDDNMMGSSESTITDGGSQSLTATNTYKWYLEGNDPYAIKIKNKAGKYVYSSDDASCALSDDASTFMLLPKDNYEYGVLQKTGMAKMLSGYGNTLTASDPTKFVIFAMATYDVIYHLVIANIGETESIPYAEMENGVRVAKADKVINGSTMRDLTSVNDDGVTHYDGEKYQLGDTINGQTYCKKVGPISLGDQLAVPDVLKRRNCKYFYYVEGIYSDAACNTPAMSTDATPVQLNSKYKGLLVDDIVTDEDLIHTYVQVNVEYQFDDGLSTNNGSGFVTDVSENKWYTFETVRSKTPWLAQFTNAWGLEIKEGRGTHYTNDYLWTPVGDPYGFLMYNRYTYLNSGSENTGETNRVMTTEGFTSNEKIIMSPNNELPSAQPNAVYELLAERNTTQGYFLIHPVVNNTGTQYYLGIVTGDDDGDGVSNDYLKLSTTPTELGFGLNEELVTPYYERAGYVGGLTVSGKELYEAASDLMGRQAVVYDLANIVSFTPGYYRLHSPSDIDGVSERYASGYNHKIEETGTTEYPNPVPMHFYERKGVNTTYEILGGGYTFSAATRGAITITAPEYDPASIFYLSQVPSESPFSQAEHDNANMAIMGTQGLYVKSSVAKGTAENSNSKSKAIMSETQSEATSLYIMDIGGAIMLIHDNYTDGNRANLKYLSFDQTDPDSIYDLKLTHNTNTDHAKWLLEPANDQGLKVTTNSGADGYYYTTFCAPYDVLLKGANDAAYICKQWETNIIHLKKVGKYNTEENGCPEDYRGNDKFIPAGTPVVIRTPTVGDVSMTLPGTVSTSIGACIFSGKYLEQKLDATDPVKDVYTFGLPYASGLSKAGTDEEYRLTGEISNVSAVKAESGVGFYINANPNKELGLARASWIRNNRYVLHNKIYYREDSSGASASRRGDMDDEPEFIPVAFDDEDDPIGDNATTPRQWCDNRVYDLQGRCVVTEEMVKNNDSWMHRLAPGVYILNGQKMHIRR